MKQEIQHLNRIANQPSRLIIGLMSGTSLDGLDVALCRLTGSGPGTGVEIIEFDTVIYDADFKTEIREVFAKKLADLEKVCLLNAWIGREHGRMILECLHRWKVAPADVDLIASHGQTIYHAPKILHQLDKFPNATLQIGDGDHLAVATGIITLCDFRQKHIAAGGEGAPLAAYGDFLIFSKAGEDRIMLNIGGIANFTYLPGNLDATSVFSTDTGPGNTMMDACAQRFFQQPYDKGSAIARSGKVNDDLLAALLAQDFFAQSFPKTTGPELFNLAYLNAAILKAGVVAIRHEDVMATLNRFTAVTIADAIRRSTASGKYKIYSSGGGMHNPLLMEHLRELLPQHDFYTTADLNINPDAKEALLFAVLANECVAGEHLSVGNGTREIPAVSMGKICLPG